jgi:hypothetical protein
MIEQALGNVAKREKAVTYLWERGSSPFLRLYRGRTQTKPGNNYEDDNN